ncbi:glutamine--fructose-6-phosphate transaminase (isomerizing) [Modestobacter sp. SSW1-42]|uniref:glutamine--fructose-6-phosphate transaminase (isomerizing) n=1 Tax=Modestobacter sp. SSW1-42 TaxID=596372 RepID=UPI0039878838
MCGIVACRGRERAAEFLAGALSRLEYRGYDSAGIAVTGLGQEGLTVVRAVGRVASLQERLAALAPPAGSCLGIGHTRWATHGSVSETNAHPHRDCQGAIAVVHNGIIDNADELVAELRGRGHLFTSDVDSEVVAHLVEEHYAGTGSLAAATLAATRRLRGTWALAVTAATSRDVVLASHRSPLVVGSGPEGHVAASDVTALVGTVGSVSVLQDGDVVVLGDEVTWLDATGAAVPHRESVRLHWAADDVERGAYDDFMEKEIAEQPAVVGRLLERLLPEVADGRLWSRTGLAAPERLRFLACGSSRHAAEAVARAFGVLGGVPAEVVVASEHDELVVPGGADGVLTVAISQSGETSDVLHALEDVRGPVLAITNRPHSSLARRSDAVLETGAGPEIGVAATKTFTTQVVAGAALAIAHAAATGALSRQAVAQHGLRLGSLPGRLAAAHTTSFPVAVALAEELAEAQSFFFVSRGAGLPYAAEGALKLKEITYRNAEALPAGEFKHGPIALIEQGTPVLLLESGDPARLAGAAAELAARGARVIRIGSGGTDTFPVLSGPPSAWGPLESVVALQHLARCVAVVLGRDADKPRNLAKSVTVL